VQHGEGADHEPDEEPRIFTAEEGMSILPGAHPTTNKRANVNNGV
jgi:hypothetical protein